MFRPNNEGTYRIDRSFKGVGRIQRASGVNDAETFDQIVAALKNLYRLGRVDVLRQVRDGHITPIEILHAQNLQQLDSLRSAEDVLPLYAQDRNQSRLLTWLKGLKRTERTKAGYFAVINIFHKFCTAKSTVGDIPAVLKKMRNEYEKQGKCRTFNQTRTMLQSYASSIGKGRHGNLWIDIASVPVLKVIPQRLRNPITVEQAVEMMKYLKPDVAKMFWFLCTSGMNWKEFTEDGWLAEGSVLKIFGKKRASRERIIPLVSEPIGAVLTIKHFNKALRKAGKKSGVGRFSSIDTRRTFAKWTEESSIPASRAMQYQGHKPITMTSHYATSSVANSLDLKADRATFIAYLDRRKGGLAVVA